MDKKYLSLITVVFCLLFHISSSYAATLHAILVFDTISKDIKETVKIDQAKIENFLNEVSHYTGMEKNVMIFNDRQFAPKKVRDTVQELSPKEDDVVFFYYSGHGFRTHKMETPWPAIVSPLYAGYLEIGMVIDILREKKQHLSFVIADCCNNYLPDVEIPKTHFSDYALLKNGHIQKNYQRLFTEQQGMLIAVGAEPGDYSYCNEQVGGLFTNALLNMIHFSTRNHHGVEWKMILDLTAKFVIAHQRPLYHYY